MSSHPAESPENILHAFEQATTTFNLCPNRVWAVARHDLPKLVPAAKAMHGLDDHTQCTIDFCEHSQRDFTSVEQRHECKNGNCGRREFPQKTLEHASKNGQSTVWALNGKDMLLAPRPYMAISHVWSDGTGTGCRPDGEVNNCLYDFFEGIARVWECEGIWWDTISIPRERAARNLAIRNIQSNYQDARVTLVHDCFLRNSQWVDAEAACFAILMSPWFSRGWTALELANSRNVKVLFKGRRGFVMKDLDEAILCKGQTRLRGARCTSWQKDIAVISGLLIGVDVAPPGQRRDVFQQNIYKRVLTKIGKLAVGHLFHNSATICKGSSWCPIDLFSIPISGQAPTLVVEDELDLIGRWDIAPFDGTLEQKCIWNGTHPLLRMQLQLALQDVDKCVLLTECGTEAVDRALLVKLKEQEGLEGTLCFQYVGALHFHPGLPKRKFVKAKVRILGDASGRLVNDRQNAWKFVNEMANSSEDDYWESEERPSQEIQDEKIKALWPTRGRTICERDTKRTALHYAILRSDHFSFQKLLRISNTEAQDALGQLPLHLAAERGDPKMLYHLLVELFGNDAGDIDRRNVILCTPCSNGQTTLHLAVFACSATVVDLLLKAGVYPSPTDDNGNTALHIAARIGHEPVVRRLLEGGAKPNHVDREANTALHIAVRNGHELVIERLLEAGVDLNLMDKNNDTALHLAIKCGSKSMVKRLLLDNRCDVNIAKLWGFTPLYCAVESGNEHLVRMLVEKSADMNKACGLKRVVPLQLAVYNGCHSIIEFLISSGADVNSRDVDRFSLLHEAVNREDEATMLLLLKRGANVNVTDKSSLTPLHYAARRGNKASVELLIDFGASLNTKGCRGSTPFDFAIRMGHQKVANMLGKWR